jgi:hypothetical protein
LPYPRVTDQQLVLKNCIDGVVVLFRCAKIL